MYQTFCKKLSAILAIITGSLLIGVLSISMLNIVLRNIFSVSWLVLDVLSKLMFVWMIFFGTSVVYFHADHLKMDFFSMKFPPKVKKLFAYLFSLISLIVLLVMLVYGIEISRVRMSIPFESYKAIPTGLLFASLPVCAVLMIIFTIGHFQNLRRIGSVVEISNNSNELDIDEQEVLKGIEGLSSMIKEDTDE